MRYYLGIDGGGTKTAAAILDEERREVGRGYGGPCNIATVENVALRESVLGAVDSALAAAGLPRETRFAGACAGVAGYTAKKRRAEFQRMFAESVAAESHRVEPDYVIAYWGATEGEPGIIVIAGTGSAAFGRNANGESMRVDGRGFLLGDRGSGFDIGAQSLSLALRRLDGEGDASHDEFMGRILEAIGAADSDDVVEWTYRPFEPGRIASLARTVGELADKGNDLALSLIDNSATILRTYTLQLKDKLAMGANAPVYTLGGLWNLGSVIREPFRRWNATGSLQEFNVCEPRHDAAYGAALLAVASSR